MNKNVRRQYRTGGANKAIRPAGVAQIGASQGTHVMEPSRELPYRGISMKAGPALPSKLGDELVNNVGAGCPGKGRTCSATRAGSFCERQTTNQISVAF